MVAEAHSPWAAVAVVVGGGSVLGTAQGAEMADVRAEAAVAQVPRGIAAAFALVMDALACGAAGAWDSVSTDAAPLDAWGVEVAVDAFRATLVTSTAASLVPAPRALPTVCPPPALLAFIVASSPGTATSAEIRVGLAEGGTP